MLAQTRTIEHYRDKARDYFERAEATRLEGDHRAADELEHTALCCAERAADLAAALPALAIPRKSTTDFPRWQTDLAYELSPAHFLRGTAAVEWRTERTTTHPIRPEPHIADAASADRRSELFSRAGGMILARHPLPGGTRLAARYLQASLAADSQRYESARTAERARRRRQQYRTTPYPIA